MTAENFSFIKIKQSYNNKNLKSTKNKKKSGIS